MNFGPAPAGRNSSVGVCPARASCAVWLGLWRTRFQRNRPRVGSDVWGRVHPPYLTSPCSSVVSRDWGVRNGTAVTALRFPSRVWKFVIGMFFCLLYFHCAENPCRTNPANGWVSVHPPLRKAPLKGHAGAASSSLGCSLVNLSASLRAAGSPPGGRTPKP